MQTNLSTQDNLVTFTMQVTLLEGDGAAEPPVPHAAHPLWKAPEPAQCQLVGVQDNKAVLPLPCTVGKAPMTLKDGEGCGVYVAESGKHKTPGKYVTFNLVGPDGKILFGHNHPGLAVQAGQRLRVEFIVHRTTPKHHHAARNAGVGAAVAVEAKPPVVVETE